MIRLHRENQTFLRHCEELWLELADIDRWPFHKRIHFVEQIDVTRGRTERGVQCRRLCFELRKDHAATRGEYGFDFAVLTQQFFVARSAIKLNIVCTLKAMTVGNTS